MPILHVLPTEIVTQNVELMLQLKLPAQDYVKGLIAPLNLTQATPEQMKSVPFAKARSGAGQFWNWAGKNDVALQSYFLAPPAVGVRQEFFRFAALVEIKSCQFLGGVWQRGEGALQISGIPAEILNNSPLQGLSPILARQVKTVSPVALNVQFSTVEEQWVATLSLLEKVIVSESFAAQGVPVVSALSKVNCNTGGNGAVLGQRPHRVLHIVHSDASNQTAADATRGDRSANSAAAEPSTSVLGAGLSAKREGASKSLVWPQLRSHVVLRGGVFWGHIPLPGEKEDVSLSEGSATPSDSTKNAQSAGTPSEANSATQTSVNAAVIPKANVPVTPFNPIVFFSTLKGSYDAASHNLAQPEFAITSRSGKFVFLNRGKAFGLQIGMHLIGPAGQKLHVVQFRTAAKEADVAVALVRKEEAGGVLKEGDMVRIDLTQYPEGLSSGTLGPKSGSAPGPSL